jgi:hypothetical protein
VAQAPQGDIRQARRALPSSLDGAFLHIKTINVSFWPDLLGKEKSIMPIAHSCVYSLISCF